MAPSRWPGRLAFFTLLMVAVMVTVHMTPILQDLLVGALIALRVRANLIRRGRAEVD